jgi:hypothetical protein
MTAQYLVERTSQTIAGTPPPPDLIQPKDRRTTEPDEVEVLVDDRIPPIIQFFEQLHASQVLRVMDFDFIPERDLETTEVRADAAGLSIATIQETAPSQLGSHQLLQCRRRCDRCQDVDNALAVKISTEPLELRRKQHSIRVIELLGIEPF